MIPISSPELYEAYKAWRDQDVDDRSSLGRGKANSGLCIWVINFGDQDEIQTELDRQFDASGLDHLHPFDSPYSYTNRKRMGTQHLNPMRIQWVNDRIADYEKEHGL